MPRKLTWDKSLFTVATLLVVIGLIMVFSASAVIAMDIYGSEYTFLVKQTVFVMVGLVAMVFLMNVPYRIYGKRSVVYGFLAAVMGLLVVVLMLPPVAQHQPVAAPRARSRFSPRSWPSWRSSSSWPTSSPASETGSTTSSPPSSHACWYWVRSPSSS